MPCWLTLYFDGSWHKAAGCMHNFCQVVSVQLKCRIRGKLACREAIVHIVALENHVPGACRQDADVGELRQPAVNTTLSTETNEHTAAKQCKGWVEFCQSVRR